MQINISLLHHSTIGYIRWLDLISEFGKCKIQQQEHTFVVDAGEKGYQVVILILSLMEQTSLRCPLLVGMTLAFFRRF